MRMTIKNGGDTIRSDVCDRAKVMIPQFPTVFVHIQYLEWLLWHHNLCDASVNGKIADVWSSLDKGPPAGKHVSFEKAPARASTGGKPLCLCSKSVAVKGAGISHLSAT
jgi:hypothetical protein